MSRSENKMVSSRNSNDKMNCSRLLHFPKPSCKICFGYLKFDEEIDIWLSQMQCNLALVLYTRGNSIRVLSFSVVVTVAFQQFRVQQIKYKLASKKLNAVWHRCYKLKQNVSKRRRCRRQERR